MRCWAKPFSWTCEDPGAKKKLETQILHSEGGQWRGYTYVWNDAQTDADLLDAHGKDIVLKRPQFASQRSNDQPNVAFSKPCRMHRVP